MAAEEAAETLGVVGDEKRGALSARSKNAGGEEKDNNKTHKARDRTSQQKGAEQHCQRLAKEPAAQSGSDSNCDIRLPGLQGF